MDVLKGPPARNSARTNDDVPLRAPMFGRAPATNARRQVRYGQDPNSVESKQQLLINAVRGRVKNPL